MKIANMKPVYFILWTLHKQSIILQHKFHTAYPLRSHYVLNILCLKYVNFKILKQVSYDKLVIIDGYYLYHLFSGQLKERALFTFGINVN